MKGTLATSRWHTYLTLMASDASPLGVQFETISRGAMVECGSDVVFGCSGNVHVETHS